MKTHEFTIIVGTTDDITYHELKAYIEFMLGMGGGVSMENPMFRENDPVEINHLLIT